MFTISPPIAIKTYAVLYVCKILTRASYHIVHGEASLWGFMMLRNDKMEAAKLAIIKWTEWTRTLGNYIWAGLVIVRDFY